MSENEKLQYLQLYVQRMYPGLYKNLVAQTTITCKWSLAETKASTKRTRPLVPVAWLVE